jgi:hypothetical protein
MPLQDALATFIEVGSTLTAKVVWSFGDSMSEAMQYQNGIILVANPPEGAVSWDAASYITPLSDDSTKTEYTFLPGTSFLVQDIAQQTIQGKPVVVITMQVQSLDAGLTAPQPAAMTASAAEPPRGGASAQGHALPILPPASGSARRPRDRGTVTIRDPRGHASVTISRLPSSSDRKPSPKSMLLRQMTALGRLRLRFVTKIRRIVTALNRLSGRIG